MVLLDIIYRATPHRPPLVFADSQMEYPETLGFIQNVAAIYGARLFVAKAGRSPLEQWAKQGWPMLGKLAARNWTRNHRDAGFKCEVTACCQNMKSKPARKLIRKKGHDLQFTGQRGNQDDALRGLRTIRDGITFFVKTDRLTVCNPLTGWTDTMIRRYTEQTSFRCTLLKNEGR